MKDGKSSSAARASDDVNKQIGEGYFSDKTSVEDYIIGKQIGQGAYAVVRVGLHKPSGKKVAMKIYKKYKLLDINRRKSVRREIKLM